MIYLRPYLTFSNLILFILVEVCILLCILKFTKYHKPAKDSTIQDYLRYIDKYYITNMFLTSSAVLIYIICHISLLILFRYLTLSTKINIVPIEPTVGFVLNFWLLFSMLSKFILIIVAIVLLYNILEQIFFTSVIKLYIFAQDLSLIYNICYKVKMSSFKNSFGSLYLFIDNIALLNFDLSEDNYDDHYEHRDIYDNPFIKDLHIKFILLCEHYSFIHLFFILLKKLLRLFYIHFNINFLMYFVPGITIFSTLIYDVIVKQSLHNIYVTLLIISILRLGYKVYLFIDNKLLFFDGLLSDYFYKNSLPYEKQRLFLKNNSDKNTKILQESKENKALTSALNPTKNLKEYLIQDFNCITSGAYAIQKKIDGIYLRFIIIICNLILSIFFIRHYFDYTLYLGGLELPHIVLVLPLGFMYYCHLQIYKQVPHAEVEGFNTYIYNRTFSRIFGILLIIQAYIFWLLIFKSYIFRMPDEYLFNYYNIELLINLSIEKKLEIFELYFKHYAECLGFTKEYLELILSYKEEINFSDIVLIKDIRIKEIKDHIEQLINNYAQYVIEYHEDLKQQEEKTALRMKTMRSFMDAFSNIINLITFWTFFKEHVNATYIIYKAPNLKTAKLAFWFVKILNKYLRKP